MGSRLTWSQIRTIEAYKGRWVALDDCRYDARTAQPVEGTVVDADEDLVTLCNRMQESDKKQCAILFCEEGLDEPVPSSARAPRYTPIPPRPFTH